MNGFGQLVQEWQVFYATIATASATLIGLLFVAMSLNLGSGRRVLRIVAAWSRGVSCHDRVYPCSARAGIDRGRFSARQRPPRSMKIHGQAYAS